MVAVPVAIPSQPEKTVDSFEGQISTEPIETKNQEDSEYGTQQVQRSRLSRNPSQNYAKRCWLQAFSSLELLEDLRLPPANSEFQ